MTREEREKAMQVELEGDGYADGELVYDYGKPPKCGSADDKTNIELLNELYNENAKLCKQLKKGS